MPNFFLNTLYNELILFRHYCTVLSHLAYNYTPQTVLVSHWRVMMFSLNLHEFRDAFGLSEPDIRPRYTASKPESEDDFVVARYASYRTNVISRLPYPDVRTTRTSNNVSTIRGTLKIHRSNAKNRHHIYITYFIFNFTISRTIQK